MTGPYLQIKCVPPMKVLSPIYSVLVTESFEVSQYRPREGT